MHTYIYIYTYRVPSTGEFSYHFPCMLESVEYFDGKMNTESKGLNGGDDKDRGVPRKNEKPTTQSKVKPTPESKVKPTTPEYYVFSLPGIGEDKVLWYMY
jgi:hypothetical protein